MENLQFYYNMISVMVFTLVFIRWSSLKIEDVLFKFLLFVLCLTGISLLALNLLEIKS